MASLKAFLKQNALLPENKRVVISNRFIDDETGKPMEWELRAIPEKENARIKDSCMQRDYSKAARKQGRTVDFDSSMYVRRLLVASVVFPDLQDSTLQASYGVVGEEELLGEMLYSDEYALLQEEVDDFSGYISQSMEDDKEEVKNS